MERTTLGWCERGEGWAANLLHPRRARARRKARQIRKAPWRKILCPEITNWMRKIHRVHQVTKRGKPFPRQKKVCAESSWKPPREGRKIRLRSIEVIDYFASLSSFGFHSHSYTHSHVHSHRARLALAFSSSSSSSSTEPEKKTSHFLWNGMVEKMMEGELRVAGHEENYEAARAVLLLVGRDGNKEEKIGCSCAKKWNEMKHLEQGWMDSKKRFSSLS